MDDPFSKTIHLTFWKALLPVHKTSQMLLVKLQNTGWLKTIAMFHQANKQAANGCLYVSVWNRKFVLPPQNTQCVVLNRGSWKACGNAVGTRTTLNSHYL